MEGYDKFREMLTSHLDESSAKGKGGLLGMDRDERTGLLIGSAVSALMGGVSGQNPLATGLAAYGQGADNIYNKRKQAIDMEQQQARGELSKVNAFINYQNAQKKAAATPIPQNAFDDNYRQIIQGQLGKWNSQTGQYEWVDEGNQDIANMAYKLQIKYQRQYPQKPQVAAAYAIEEARKIYAQKQAALEAKASKEMAAAYGDSVNPLKTGKFNLKSDRPKDASDWRNYIGG